MSARRREASVRAAAIVCVRNEELHVGEAIAGLIAEGLEVVLIDHDSTDRTHAIASDYLGRGLLAIERLAWTGWFSLSEQLAAKARIAEELEHDWIVHADADEWLSAPEPDRGLIDGLAEADAGGYNCVNFDEFVFLPRPGADESAPGYRRRMTRYYFFQPSYPRLLRAYKNRAGLSNGPDGGHLLAGPARRFPHDFPLRHYIALSEPLAARKYLERPFDPAEIHRGWHRNRLALTGEWLRFPGDAKMRALPVWSSKEFDKTAPWTEHYWDANRRGRAVGAP